MPGDLRNRVVGARLIEEGVSPYLYKWKPGDSFRYYDTSNLNKYKASNITASPLFHQLLIPLGRMPYTEASKLWFFLQQVILVFAAAIAFFIARTKSNRSAVLVLTPLLMLTFTFQHHLLLGQIYIVNLLLLIAIAALLVKNLQAAAAVATVALILLKPTTAIAFIPLLLIIWQLKRFFLVASVLGLAYLGYLLVTPFQFELWKHYKLNIEQQVKIHQQADADTFVAPTPPTVLRLEGWDIKEAYAANRKYGSSLSENGNLFVIYNKLTGTRLTTNQLALLLASSIVILLGAFYFRHNNKSPSVIQCLLLGFVLYAVTDFASPVYRHQYYGVQYFFPLLLVAATGSKTMNKTAIGLLGIGLSLNLLTVKIIPMQYTFGEILILAGSLVEAFRKRGLQ